MCGIFGSNNIKTFRELCNKNSERGNFVRSVTKLFLPNTKHNGVNVTTELSQDFNKSIEEDGLCVYYLGHVQSPTTEVREFKTNTSHPFRFKNTYIAHNGVLENSKQLKEKYDLPANDVDSSIIPPLIHRLGYKEALSALKGTFGCWSYDQQLGQLRIFRSGSTLCIRGSSFSSAYKPDYESVEQGVIYECNFSTNTFFKVDSFSSKSPFFL
jgi:glutamine phosphoribosylpyrophosphate amidotransferase